MLFRSSGGRRSSGALTCSIGSYATKTLSSSATTMVIGFAIKPTSLSDSWRDFLSLFEGATQHLTFCIKAAGKILIYRGNSSGTLLATGNTTISAGVWTYIEVKVTINDTTGSTEVRINGVADSALTLTNTDTRNGGTTGATNRGVRPTRIKCSTSEGVPMPSVMTLLTSLMSPW